MPSDFPALDLPHDVHRVLYIYFFSFGTPVSDFPASYARHIGITQGAPRFNQRCGGQTWCKQGGRASA